MPEKKPDYHGPKIIQRDPEGIVLRVLGMEGEVKYHTGEWETVEGANGVLCRTWMIAGTEDDVDGADIIIKAGGWTPIQLVQAAEIVVDAPETGEGWVVAMDAQGDEVYVNYFDGSEPFQMNWSEGMIICWIAKNEVSLTEFESPAFSEAMFVTVPENVDEFRGRDISKLLETVRFLRGEANPEQP